MKGKVWLVIMVLLWLGGIVFTGYGMYQLREKNSEIASIPKSENKPTASAGNHVSIRQQLGTYLGEGEELKRRCLNKEDAKVLFKDAQHWVRLVSTYLVAKLDASYGEQFFSPPAQMPIGHDVPPENDNLWRSLNGHTEVLRKFITEFKD
jgi:hypothetical protein